MDDALRLTLMHFDEEKITHTTYSITEEMYNTLLNMLKESDDCTPQSEFYFYKDTSKQFKG